MLEIIVLVLNCIMRLILLTTYYVISEFWTRFYPVFVFSCKLTVYPIFSVINLILTKCFELGSFDECESVICKFIYYTLIKFNVMINRVKSGFDSTTSLDTSTYSRVNLYLFDMFLLIMLVFSGSPVRKLFFVLILLRSVMILSATEIELQGYTNMKPYVPDHSCIHFGTCTRPDCTYFKTITKSPRQVRDNICIGQRLKVLYCGNGGCQTKAQNYLPVYHLKKYNTSSDINPVSLQDRFSVVLKSSKYCLVPRFCTDSTTILDVDGKHWLHEDNVLEYSWSSKNHELCLTVKNVQMIQLSCKFIHCASSVYDLLKFYPKSLYTTVKNSDLGIPWFEFKDRIYGTNFPSMSLGLTKFKIPIHEKMCYHDIGTELKEMPPPIRKPNYDSREFYFETKDDKEETLWERIYLGALKLSPILTIFDKFKLDLTTIEVGIKNLINSLLHIGENLMTRFPIFIKEMTGELVTGFENKFSIIVQDFKEEVINLFHDKYSETVSLLKLEFQVIKTYVVDLLQSYIDYYITRLLDIKLIESFVAILVIYCVYEDWVKSLVILIIFRIGILILF